jgi:DNA-directed RNA polymerase specialized sigma24 family protein
MEKVGVSMSVQENAEYFTNIQNAVALKESPSDEDIEKLISFITSQVRYRRRTWQRQDIEHVSWEVFDKFMKNPTTNTTIRNRVLGLINNEIKNYKTSFDQHKRAKKQEKQDGNTGERIHIVHRAFDVDKYDEKFMLRTITEYMQPEKCLIIKEDEHSRQEFYRRLWKAYYSLSTKYQIILEHTILKGETAVSLALVTGMAVSNIYKHRRRAILKLKKLLGPYTYY